MTDTRRYLTEEERDAFEKARRKSGEKVPQNYEGDHYDTIAASLITQWGEGLRGYQAANLQQAVANCIRNECSQQDEAIQCAAELIAAKDAEIARLREAIPPLVKTVEYYRETIMNTECLNGPDGQPDISTAPKTVREEISFIDGDLEFAAIALSGKEGGG